MALASPFPDVEIPNKSVPEAVLAAGRERPDAPALIDGLKGDVITHGQLAQYVDRVAANLHARGLRKGDVVAVFCPNTQWFPVVFHGIAAAGCVMSPINSLYTPDEIAFQLKDSGAKILITISMFLDRATAAAEKSPVDEIVVLDGAEGHANLFDLLGADAPSVQVDIDPAEDLVTLPYSSGTTGLPKGVMLTHRNLVANVTQCLPLLKTGADERIIAVLPFFHIYGLTVLMNQGLALGGTVVTLPRFELEDFLRTIQDHKITRAFVAPPILLALAKHPLVDQYDLSSLQSILSGAAPLDEQLALAVEQRLRAKGGSVTVAQGYGMTELSPVSHTTPDPDAMPPGFSGEVPKGSVGFAIPNTECRLIDPSTGEDAAPGERGELWVRGPQVMKGYLNNEEATRSTVDAEGWLHTGDVAIVDDNGIYTVVDRVKELIKYKGYQVAPAELEAVLINHPEIADAAVIGVPDKESGEELPKAFVVRAQGSELTEDAVMAYMGEKVAPHKKIRFVEFIDQVPKSSAGKILRKELKARA
ncbi:Acyl-CoA synthetase (AMP-forming)/AMP-acid ligase II [Blastococcus aurantiacus]|uniref:Acyl-CoA synthetase (AMP-forming)/AMP-acid ligase II n=1 Tax=Blastococcus aurantiacus TaxID=1550231 RepID=A0A1G7MYZ7_9ACTN|nr:4-coumarate--CoA ligase family protein [Blastococcus aurantiacus]SDF66974.1 Acyl-CoA synthetase (AMP-forming)/AMP-acid ligase II [Blastococcus aurantiacus]